MRAYDFDGTIVVTPYFGEHDPPMRVRLPLVRGGYWINPDLNIDDVQIVLTGNPPIMKGTVQRILKEIGCKKVFVICNPASRFDFKYLAGWKANAMQLLKIEEYVDDDPDFCKALKSVWDGRCMTVKETRE